MIPVAMRNTARQTICTQFRRNFLHLVFLELFFRLLGRDSYILVSLLLARYLPITRTVRLAIVIKNRLIMEYMAERLRSI